MSINIFKELFAKHIQEITLLDFDTIINSIETPPDSKLGDYAFPCFILAKHLKKSPINIAQELANQISNEMFDKVIAINGYLNLFVNKSKFIKSVIENQSSLNSNDEKVLIEYMNANPNKPLHIGQGRNICIGDTLVRIFRYLGYTTHAVNYGDDSGVNVGYNIVGHLYYDKPLTTDKKFDHYCGQIYTEMIKLNDDEKFKQLLSNTLLNIEKADNQEITKLQYDYTRKCTIGQLESARMIGSYFDLINWETDILHIKLFEFALEKLRNSGYIRFETEGEAKNCWIIDLSSLKEFANEEKKYQILIKSDGVATYTGKDIAYAMWKLGKLGKDFFYKEFVKQPNGTTIFSTSSNPKDNTETNFGNYNKAIAVIDNRQSFAQKVVKGALQILGFLGTDKEYIHLSYGVVYLTPQTLMQFGYDLNSDEKAKERLPFSTRKGRFVTIDETIQILKQKALIETQKRNPDKDQNWLNETALKIAIGSFRFFLTKTDHNKDITFDINEVLDMEGETGTYVMYTFARIKSILSQIDLNTIGNINTEILNQDIEFEITKSINNFENILNNTKSTLSPYILCRYILDLCKIFNSYYANFSILKNDDQLKYARISLLHKLFETLKIAINLVGIPEIDRM